MKWDLLLYKVLKQLVLYVTENVVYLCIYNINKLIGFIMKSVNKGRNHVIWKLETASQLCRIHAYTHE